MGEPNYITPRGLERIRRELEWLEREERPKVVAEVAYAASLGDRSENAEYIYGKKRLREIDRRRGFLVKRLETAQLVDPAALRGDKVLFGATVVVANADGSEKTWSIWGEDEVDVEGGVLSWRSPLARALMGKRPGDAVTYATPGGLREVELLDVKYGPQPPLPEPLEFLR
jgi:transcription elongation factor GreB